MVPEDESTCQAFEIEINIESEETRGWSYFELADDCVFEVTITTVVDTWGVYFHQLENSY
jgi:hypothetical protein